MPVHPSTGESCVEIACSEWKIEPRRRVSFVSSMPRAHAPKSRWYTRPPDLFTMKSEWTTRSADCTAPARPTAPPLDLKDVIASAALHSAARVATPRRPPALPAPRSRRAAPRPAAHAREGAGGWKKGGTRGARSAFEVRSDRQARRRRMRCTTHTVWLAEAASHEPRKRTRTRTTPAKQVRNKQRRTSRRRVAQRRRHATPLGACVRGRAVGERGGLSAAAPRPPPSAPSALVFTTRAPAQGECVGARLGGDASPRTVQDVRTGRRCGGRGCQRHHGRTSGPPVDARGR